MHKEQIAELETRFDETWATLVEYTMTKFNMSSECWDALTFGQQVDDIIETFGK